HTHKTPKTTGQRFKRISPVRKPQSFWGLMRIPLYSKDKLKQITVRVSAQWLENDLRFYK
ncbi:hypothetical protein P4N68_08610, partial [Corynebacterium felinum]|uniref:hypothetical protein n=1 Tax=Corynebacterium felinum TaxID=131318 RepID=UPI0023F9C6A4